MNEKRMTEETMAKARAASRANREARKAQGLPSTRTPLELAAADTKSLRKAITAKCYECMGSGGDPHWQRSVANCTSPDCPLYPVRPHQRLHGDPVPVSLRT